MNLLTGDLINYLAKSYLTDRAKAVLLTGCKNLHEHKNKIIFKKVRHLSTIIKSIYYDQFEMVMIDIFPKRFPLHVKNITLISTFNQPINFEIPSSVRKIYFGNNFNQSIRGCIPYGVTHITFGDDFNSSIDENIPSVKSEGADTFNQPIQNIHSVKSEGADTSKHYRGCLPTSITNLIFGKKFNQPIQNCIPSSVTHLIFGHLFNQSIDDLPYGIEELTFTGQSGHYVISSYFNKPIKNLPF